VEKRRWLIVILIRIKGSSDNEVMPLVLVSTAVMTVDNCHSILGPDLDVLAGR